MIADSLGLVGTTVAEKYGIQQVVGEGGFAIVYRAEHLLWKRPVALKVFKALAGLPASARQELTESFIQEGALLAELSEKSVSICQARDVGVLSTKDGAAVPYMVLEWLQGQSLEDALENDRATGAPPRSLLDTIRLLDPVAEALALAHARGIAHRDVKPANIFLLGDAREGPCPVKLLDFGIAKVVHDMQAAGGAFNQTTGALTSFTPAYAAPEQFARSHGPTGPWTDVFALALVAVELLTGKPPLEGESFIQLGFAAGDPNVRPTPRTRGAVVSDEVEAVFRRALAVPHDARYPSADPLWHELRVAAGLSAVPAAPRSSVSRPGSISVPTSQLVSPATVDAFARTASSQDLAGEALGGSEGALRAAPRSSWRLGAMLGIPLAAAVALAVAFAAGEKRGDPKGASPPRASAAAASARPVAAAASAPVAGDRRCSAGMAYIPGGPFFMGSDDGTPPEKPAHKVSVPPYCMDIHEVTTARYIACSNAGWCKRASTTNAGEGWPSPDQEAYDLLCNERDPAGRAEHPINCVTWEMADVFCRSQHARLPTEAEWEFAARGSDGRPYPWGDAPPSPKYLNACGSECAAWGVAARVAPLKPMYEADDGFPNTAPVGSFPEGRSQFGILDLAGNVWEWVSDWYGPYGSGDGLHPEVSPKGPDKGTSKVIRGGAWNGSDPSWERPSFRYAREPADRGHGVGFRCAGDPSGA